MIHDSAQGIMMHERGYCWEFSLIFFVAAAADSTVEKGTKVFTTIAEIIKKQYFSCRKRTAKLLGLMMPTIFDKSNSSDDGFTM